MKSKITDDNNNGANSSSSITILSNDVQDMSISQNETVTMDAPSTPPLKPLTAPLSPSSAYLVNSPATPLPIPTMQRSTPTSPTKQPKPKNTSHNAHPICHGKVTDLESLVPSQWWKTVFADSMYLKTDGDVVEDPEITAEEILLLEEDPVIKKIFLTGKASGEPAKILDLCCGQGRHSNFLANKYPHLHMHGHDQSSYLVDLARERAKTMQLTSPPTFTVGDCRSTPYPDNTFDLVMVMGNSFGYFESDDSDCSVLLEIKRILKPNGRMILDCADGGWMRQNFAEKSWEWVDHTCFVCRERQLSRDGKRLYSREVITSTFDGVIRDQFYQERLYDRAEIECLIQKSGMDVVPMLPPGQQHQQQQQQAQQLNNTPTISVSTAGTAATTSAELDSDAVHPNSNSSVMTAAAQLSKRGEDLGMMGFRMIVKASKKSDVIVEPMPLATPTSVESIISETDRATLSLPPLPKFAVAMGDPARPCFGKLNNTWNEEDFITRDKLQQALLEIGFPADHIECWSDHTNLAKQLATSNPRPEFVFNLCDEGFDNDALKELHIPAYLEMLQIPYTGAGPNCLAFCYDKGLVNRTAEALGVPTPRETYYFADHNADEMNTDLANIHGIIESEIAYPAFIKPLKGDNSLGITGKSIVYNEQELDAYLKELRSIGIRDIIIQEYLQGTEYGVGVVGNTDTGFHFFPVMEVDFANITSKNLPPILGYESKWDPTSPYWTDIQYKKARLSPEVEAKLKRHCIVLWERFGCKDYARFDFRCDRGSGDGFSVDGQGAIKLLEVNPNPGWCWDGKLAYMAKFQGLSYADMIRLVLEAACFRVYGQQTDDSYCSSLSVEQDALRRDSKVSEEVVGVNGNGTRRYMDSAKVVEVLKRGLLYKLIQQSQQQQQQQQMQ